MSIIPIEGANEAGILENLMAGRYIIYLPNDIDLSQLVFYRFDTRGRVYGEKVKESMITCVLEEGDSICLFHK